VQESDSLGAARRRRSVLSRRVSAGEIGVLMGAYLWCWGSRVLRVVVGRILMF
jgi:hypothetical protein